MKILKILSGLFLLLLIGESRVFALDKTYDLLIKNAVIYDGVSGNPSTGDVAVKGDKIAAVGNLSGSKAAEVIDAKGLALAPGFIDTHTHSDFNPVVYPDLPNKVLQGVTTEVTGNCGMSAAPVLGTHNERIKGVWAREGVEVKQEIPWKTFKEYREDLEKSGMTTNFIGLVGHGNIRSAVMGFAPRAATPQETAEMRKMLREAMNEGAAGISYGLIYLPGIFSTEDELVELCREAGKANGICAFHMRSESSQVLEAIQEAIRIGKKAKSRVEISHLKAAGKNNWDKISDAFRLIHDARKRGQRVFADVYPYTGSFAELGVLLPDVLYQREDRVTYFRDLQRRPALLKELKDFYGQKGQNWEAVMVAATHHEAYWPYEGKTLGEIAKETGKAPEEFLVEILADTGFEVSAFYFAQSEDVVDQVLNQPYVTVGSDSIADGSRKPHPRAYGTFPKILRESEAGTNHLALGEAIRKMTSLAAENFGLKKRGKIKKGYYADLVLFDPKTVKDEATYENPKDLPRGIQWVFVNGKAEVKEGKFTGIKNGKFLKPEKS